MAEKNKTTFVMTEDGKHFDLRTPQGRMAYEQYKESLLDTNENAQMLQKRIVKENVTKRISADVGHGITGPQAKERLKNSLGGTGVRNVGYLQRSQRPIESSVEDRDLRTPKKP